MVAQQTGNKEKRNHSQYNMQKEPFIYVFFPFIKDVFQPLAACT